MRKKYSEQTLKRLFALSANNCAFPDCTQNIVNENGMVIGDICHIEAAEKGGERFNAMQTDEQRSSFENLILLCANHHRITNNIEIYSVQILKKIKREHENKYKDRPYLVPEKVIKNAVEILNTGEMNLIFSNAQSVTVHQGLTLNDVTSLFQTLFEANFPKLRNIAENSAKENVEKLRDQFFKKANGKLGEQDYIKFSDPDLQFILNKAIETSARKDSAELRGNLSNLLIKRVQLSASEDLKSIVYNEAIETVGKLTTHQLKIITLVFLVRYIKFSSIKSWQSFNECLEESLQPFLDFKNTETEFQHIQYTGCGNISVLEWDMVDIYFRTYPFLFTAGIQDLSLAEEAITKTEMGMILLSTWRNSQLKNIVLTSVGTAIAASYYEQLSGQTLNINKWVN